MHALSINLVLCIGDTDAAGAGAGKDKTDTDVNISDSDSSINSVEEMRGELEDAAHSTWQPAGQDEKASPGAHRVAGRATGGQARRACHQGHHEA